MPSRCREGGWCWVKGRGHYPGLPPCGGCRRKVGAHVHETQSSGDTRFSALTEPYLGQSLS